MLVGVGGATSNQSLKNYSPRSHFLVCVGQKNKTNNQINKNHFSMIYSLEKKMLAESSTRKMNLKAKSLVAIRGKEMYEQLWPQLYNREF